MNKSNQPKPIQPKKVIGSKKPYIPKCQAIDCIKDFRAIYSTLRQEMGSLSGFPTNTQNPVRKSAITLADLNTRIQSMQKKLTPAKINKLNNILADYENAERNKELIELYANTLKSSEKDGFLRTWHTMDQLLSVPVAERFSSVDKIVPESCKKLNIAAVLGVVRERAS